MSEHHRAHLNGPNNKGHKSGTAPQSPADRLAVEPVAPPANERGAVLLIVAMMTIILIVSAGFAVDIGAWYTRAEELQQAVDSAALAGSADYVASGYDEGVARAKIDEVLLQNGIDPTDPTKRIVATYDAVTGEVSVSVGDDDVDVFFSRIIQANMGIERSAVARLDICGASCIQELEIPEPLSAATIAGSGDGWAPILIGDRVFAINHHSAVETGGDIVCVDRATQAICTGYPKNIAPLQPAGTDWTVPVAVVGSQIFYHAQRAADLVLGCFDTGNDAACGGGHIVLSSALADPGGDHDYQSRGGGTILAGDGNIYVFSEEQTFCVDPAAYATCTGFPQANGFADAGIVAGTLSGAQQSSIQIGTRIYVSHTWNLEQASLGVRLHCWDTALGAVGDACTGFGAVQVHATGDPSSSGRLFALRAPNGGGAGPGVAYGVCSIQLIDVVCVDLDGIALPDPADFESGWATLSPVKIGTPFFHDRSNRLFVPSRSTNQTYCYDFNTQSNCGITSGGLTGDYAYTSEGDCIYGLGHESLFWTFDPELNQGCRSAVTTAQIYSCVCADGTKHWGSVAFGGDLDSIFGPFETVEVIVAAPAPDNTEYINMSLMDTDGIIDLAAVPTTHDYLNIEIIVTAKLGENPWLAGEIPTIEVGWRDRVYLYD